MDDLIGKSAVITGAASGIGLALARHAAACGMNVVLADIERGSLDAAVAEVAAVAGAGGVIGCTVDVSDAASVQSLADRAHESFGAIHLLCNNAGVAVRGPLWEHSEDDWRWVLGVNVWGLIHGIRAFVPRMLAAGEPAHIVNTSSVAGLHPVATAGVYSTTKAAVAALSESLLHDLRAAGSDIGVSVLCPSRVETRIGTSDRNRPGANASVGASPAVLAAPGGYRHLDTGASPEHVAERTFQGIRDGSFYIFTSSRARDPLRRRFESVLAGEAPRAPGPEVMAADHDRTTEQQQDEE